MRLFLLFFIAFQGYISVDAQDINNLKFTNYTTKNGLPGNEVAQMLRDRHGFLWMSTIVGLSRFDGVSFKNYYGRHGDSTGVPDEGNFGMAKDRAGHLWVGGGWGLSRYNEKNDQFDYPFGYENPELLGNQYMCHDGKTTLWTSCSTGLRKVDTEKMTVGGVVFPDPNIIFMTTDSSGGLWFSALPNILGYADASSGAVKTWNSSGTVSHILIDQQHQIWLATSRGMGAFDPVTGTFSLYSPPGITGDEKIVFNLSHLAFCPKITSDSIIWCTSNLHGLWLFNIRTRQFFYNMLPQNGNFNTLPTVKLFYLDWDPTGVLWVGTKYNGLCKMDMHDQEFKQQFTGVEGLNVRAVAQDVQQPGHLWIGTTGKGLIHLDRQQNKVVGQWSPPPRRGLQDSHVLSVFDEGNGRVWLGTPSDFYCLNNNRLERIPVLPGDSASWINAIFPQTAKGYLWLMSWKGPVKLYLKTRQTTFIPMDLKSRFKGAYMFRGIHEDENGILWLATMRGLYRVDPVTREQQHFKSAGTDHFANFIHDMLPGNDGQLWLGTGNGVYVFDPKTLTFRAVKTTENLRQGAVHQLLRDPSGRIWAFTDIGTFRLQKDGQQFEKMTLPFSYVVKDQNGGIYSIFDLNGQFTSFDAGTMITFDPLLVDFNPNKTQPLIDQFRIRNQPYPFDKEAVATQSLELAYDQNFLSFDFTAINYTQPERIHFRYMLEGVDENWNETDKNRTANYPQLRPGKYTFKVLAANSAGVWNEQPAVFKVTILPPWWATWWFRVLVLGALAYTGYTFFQNRIVHIQKQAETREREAGYKQREAELQREVAEFSKQVAEVELAALRAQMNPHFVFNCLNSINTFILLNDPKNASGYLNKFSKLIRRVLDASRSEYISLNDEIETLRYYIELEQMRYGGRFQYQIHTSDHLNPEALDLPPMLIQPYVENAIWHGLMNREGDGGLLKINLEQSSGILKIRIEDNGVGRKKAAELKSKSAVAHKSHGMTVTDERIKIINELYGTDATVVIDDLFDNAGHACGTRVTLQLPVKE